VEPSHVHHRVLEANEEHAAKQARWHGRLMRALRQTATAATFVVEAVRRRGAAG